MPFFGWSRRGSPAVNGSFDDYGDPRRERRHRHIQRATKQRHTKKESVEQPVVFGNHGVAAAGAADLETRGCFGGSGLRQRHVRLLSGRRILLKYFCVIVMCIIATHLLVYSCLAGFVIPHPNGSVEAQRHAQTIFPTDVLDFSYTDQRDGYTVCIAAACHCACGWLLVVAEDWKSAKSDQVSNREKSTKRSERRTVRKYSRLSMSAVVVHCSFVLLHVLYRFSCNYLCFLPYQLFSGMGGVPLPIPTGALQIVLLCLAYLQVLKKMRPAYSSEH